MDFELPGEVKLLKEIAQRFVDEELIPRENEYRPEGEKGMPEEILKPLQEKAKDLGLWLLEVPEEYGGAGLGLLPRCVIAEELARTVLLPFRENEIFGPNVRAVLFYCNEEQKERFLYPVIRGEKRICFAQTEPDAGSDPGAMRTSATPEGLPVLGILHHHVQRPLSNSQRPSPLGPNAPFRNPFLAQAEAFSQFSNQVDGGDPNLVEHDLPGSVSHHGGPLALQ